ncbi:MAG: molybdopterin-dependent oxidoreductase [Desulfuromonadales bacterium]|nr:molybdopterin-dependent oxidoreductase [Desulfuromonadales bacterium]
MVNLKIDGKQVQIKEGATILAAAEQAGIEIPTLCYLKKVSPTGACRICVVEIEGCDTPMTACNTPATDGMVVTTQSVKLATIRRQIVELLLVNHPLDCPVCDAAGECELQNVCYEHDVDRQPFEAEDVNAAVVDRWPLIQQVPNRCVMCEKCVKVCHETVGSSALFVNEKGDRAFIDKDLDKCEFCGNCVAVCPTGTMISKTFKFKARSWEMTKVPSVCIACGAQCQIDINVKNNKVLRVTSDDETTINNGNLCIGGYFSHGYINSDQRLTIPQINVGNVQRDADWNEALTAVAQRMRTLRDETGGAAVAGLVSPRLTNEELYLFQKLFRAGASSNNIDSEARFGARRSSQVLRKNLGLTGSSHHISHIGKAEAVLVFGCDVTAEAPAIDWQIEAACRKRDGKLILANMRKIKLNRYANSYLNYRPGSEVDLVNGLCRLLLDNGLVDEQKLQECVTNYDALKKHLAKVDLAAALETTGLTLKQMTEAAATLGKAGSVALIFGADIIKSANAENTVAAICNLAILSGALFSAAGGLFPVDEKGNMQGLLDMGVNPDEFPGYQDYTTNRNLFEKAWKVSLPEGGRDALSILDGIEKGEIRLLYLVGTNPLVSFPQSDRWRKALEKVEFLIVQDILSSELTSMAHVVLPGTTFAEKSGSVTALDNRVSCLNKAIASVGESREDWEIFVDLCQRLTGGGSCPDNLAVLTEIRSLVPMYEGVCFAGSGHGQLCLKEVYAPEKQRLIYSEVTGGGQSINGLQLLTGKILFHFGTTSTFAPGPLSVAANGYVEVNAGDALSLGVADGDNLRLTSTAGELIAPVRVSAALPSGLLFAPYHFASINVQKLMTGLQNRVAIKAAKV